MFALTLFAPLTVGAATGVTYTGLTQPQTFDKGNTDTITGNFFRLEVEVPRNALSVGEQVYFFVGLPVGVSAKVDFGGSNIALRDGNGNITDREIDPLNFNKNKNGKEIADGGTIEIGYTHGHPVDETANSKFVLQFSDLTLRPKASAGEIAARFSAPQGNVFGSGSVVIAKTSTSGSVDVLVRKALTITDTSEGNEIDGFRLIEDMAGSIQGGTGVEIKLPKGFYWGEETQGKPNYDIAYRWGKFKGTEGLTKDDVKVGLGDYVADGGTSQPRLLKINLGKTLSDEALNFLIHGLKVFVDPSTAKPGPVEVEIKGKSSTVVNQSTAVIGTYGEYAADVKEFGNLKALPAGKSWENIGKWELKEQIPGSLIKGRTITLTLPAGVKWAVGSDGKISGPAVESKDTDRNGLIISDEWEKVGTDGRTIRTTITTASSGEDPGRIVYKDGRVAIHPNFNGDIVVEVAGSAGVKGEIAVAHVTPSVEAKVDELKDIKIGFKDQVIDDLYITETKPEAIEADGKTLIIEAPKGAEFSRTPAVEVVEGDLVIEKVWTSADRERVEITINALSDKISTIKVSNLAVTLDRTVPEGDFELKLKGNALVDKEIHSDTIISNDRIRVAYFAGSDVSIPVVVANVITPASTEARATAVFTIDSTNYTLGNVARTMDVAPYIKDSRTFMPVFFVAQALGVNENNIMWNANTKIVTIIKGDRVAQMQIGSKTLTVNGVSVQMDTAPEIKNGRTMLPIFFIGQALGADFEWDGDTRTVTVKQ